MALRTGIKKEKINPSRLIFFVLFRSLMKKTGIIVPEQPFSGFFLVKNSVSERNLSRTVFVWTFSRNFFVRPRDSPTGEKFSDRSVRKNILPEIFDYFSPQKTRF